MTLSDTTNDYSPPALTVSRENIKVRKLFEVPAYLKVKQSLCLINPSNAELNPICHLLALLGAHHILHVSKVRVKYHILKIHKGVEVELPAFLTSTLDKGSRLHFPDALPPVK
jgi:hypothetical protein